MYTIYEKWCHWLATTTTTRGDNQSENHVNMIQYFYLIAVRIRLTTATKCLDLQLSFNIVNYTLNFIMVKGAVMIVW
jgi:hypothetical protein